MNTRFRRISGLLLVAVILFFVVSCNSNKKSSDSKTVTILYPNWAEGVAFTHLAKVALEASDYEVVLYNLEPGLIYGELSKDDSKGDVCLDAWLPNTHVEYWKDYGDKLEILGEAFSDGTTGLVVPSYVDINSTEELNANKDKFGGEIFGSGSGDGIYANTLKAIDAYNLDFEQIASSGPAMVASLDKAIRNKEWIVITGWKPHFMWAKFDLKYLDDPKGIYPEDACTIISRRGFEEEKPEAAKFFKNFNLNEDQLYSLLDAIEKNGEEAGAKEWYEANKALVDGWK
ncbi:MAG TPA: glycine betaine ABC transporter substrate-binding protein [Prolixibacteraceae bacterium]|nr:glycine betaine ABC transporter substrate-binding protein [Prolixibacteraceae bacterium]